MWQVINSERKTEPDTLPNNGRAHGQQNNHKSVQDPQ